MTRVDVDKLSKLSDAQLGRVVRGLYATPGVTAVAFAPRANGACHVYVSREDRDLETRANRDTFDEAVLAAASAAGVDVGEPDAAEVHTRLLESTLKMILDADDTQELGKIAGAALGENVIVAIIKDYRRKLGEAPGLVSVSREQLREVVAFILDSTYPHVVTARNLRPVGPAAKALRAALLGEP